MNIIPDYETDQIICNFMESKPKLPSCWYGKELSKKNWWQLIATNGGGMEWIPKLLTLDCIHNVEECLDKKQKDHYISHISGLEGLKGKFYEDAWVFLHATLAQRKLALSRVIRFVS